MSLKEEVRLPGEGGLIEDLENGLIMLRGQLQGVLLQDERRDWFVSGGPEPGESLLLKRRGVEA